jgi:putative FmdB family regulatory protein
MTGLTIQSIAKSGKIYVGDMVAAKTAQRCFTAHHGKRKSLIRRFRMPTYDYQCEKCNKSFSRTMKISEYEKAKTKCPKCKSAKVKQRITGFQTITSRKS